MKTVSALAAALSVASTALAAVTPLAPRDSQLQSVSVKGNAFFAGNDRFYIRGVDYQPGGSSQVADPIADADSCKRDIAEFTKLGINTVRVYTVDNTADHDDCMNQLAQAGIYLVLDVNTPKYSLNRASPKESYNDVYLQSVFATIDAFAKYNNTLAFFSGNEVINSDNTTTAAPYVKAVTRDMRQYIGSRGYRQIPVGYSAADVESNRYEMAAYMNCGTDDERSDFFAFNDYSWCDPSSFTTSGWNIKVQKFSNYSLPIFLSEYGCITNKRQFQEVAALYNTEMTSVYSGGLVYEYAEEDNGYGLVTISGNQITEKDDFTALKNAFANTTNPSGDGGYKSSGSASQCPSKSSTWDVDNNDLPAIPAPAKKYMTNGAGKGPGLDGSGSQWAGTQSSGTATAGSGKVTAVATGTSKNASASGSSSSTPKSAAASLRAPESNFAPLVCGLVVLASTFFGATLL
ncbi:glycoside hydrolase family 72 protein [Xylona heveae TC161]|uniref:1,3-beta-glucanosyltransferase n=1 Tax=Xylona heveae (strain CBS 132557 / TC161) TaxID=1328760 RepID=A0A165HJ81_XYLHT|nr:glycoside hydrolase family 72 protein [Xylona heveae TC161]KZF23596.1 glycoside hydrolase family 72 protein [Xylona heveae TC161]